jgi:hypothetical protein
LLGVRRNGLVFGHNATLIPSATLSDGGLGRAFVELLSPGAFEVEFSGDQGKTCAMLLAEPVAAGANALSPLYF